MRQKVLTDPDALAGIGDEWRGLQEECPGSTVFQTWEWNRAWWNAFGGDKALRLVVVYDGVRTVGIAPFYIRRHLGTPLRRLAFVGTGASDYLDVLAAPGAERAVYDQVCAYLASGEGFDLADLQQIPESSPFVRYLEHASGNGVSPHPLSGRRIVIRPVEQCPCVPLPATWDEYLKSLGKSMRSNVGYYTRLILRDLPEARFVLCADEELPEAMTALFRLHQRRWRSRMLPGVLGSRRVQSFHYEIADRFSRRGWLRMHVIRTRDGIVAALYCFRYRERYYYYLGGFEPELARYSLGTALTAEAMRTALEEGCREFDFLRGAEAYKLRWKPDVRRNMQCLIAAERGWRADAMLTLNRLERFVEHRAKAYSDRNRGGRR